MFIAPPPYYLNNGGNPAVGFQIFIGRPNTDPTIEDNKLAITDGIDGPPVSNPYFVNGDGLARNANGQKINPYVNASEYSIQYRTPVGSLVWSNPHYKAPTGTASGGGATVVGTAIESFEVALNEDLTAYDAVYIQSYASGWQATGAGPVGDFYAYRTGSSGAASTGNPGTFYDAAGNEWKPFLSQRLYVEMFGGRSGVGNDSYQAFVDMFALANARRQPCYADNELYLIDTQANTDANYSLITVYGMKLPAYVDLRLGNNTTIKNTSAGSTQYMFFAENCNRLAISGGVLDGNAGITTDSGPLYIAGCLEVDLDVTINNSGPLYIGASTTQQTNQVRGRLEVKNGTGYGISITSGGCKEFNMPQVIIRDCVDSLHLSSKDIDGFTIPLDRPFATINSLEVINSGESITNINADMHINSINATSAGTILDFALDADDIAYAYIGSIGGSADYLCTVTSASGGKLTSLESDHSYVTGLTNGVTIDDATQLVGDVYFSNIHIDGSGDAFIFGDDTQLGNIYIKNGSTGAFPDGIVINQTNGQNIDISEVDFSGVTTKITGLDKSLWRMKDCPGVTSNNYTMATIAPGSLNSNNNLQVISSGPSLSQSETFSYLREADHLYVKKGAIYNSGTTISNILLVAKRLAIYKADDEIYLGSETGSQWTASGVDLPAQDITVAIEKSEW